MIKWIKINNLIYQNIEPKTIDPETGTEIWNIPTDLNELKKCFKDTVSWVTDRYIKENLDRIDEDLADLASELQYLNSLDTLTEAQQTRRQQILNIIAWKEQIWAKEAELEVQIDTMNFDELLKLDAEKMCKEAYKDIILEY